MGKLAESNVMAYVGLSDLRDLWIEMQGDGRSSGVEKRGLKGFR